MSNVDESLKGAFAKTRNARERTQLTAIRHKRLMDTHRNALVKDVSLALMIEIQRCVLGDTVANKFLDELQIFREHGAVFPHEFDDSVLIENIVYEVSTRGEDCPTGAAFNHLTIKAEEYYIPDRGKDVMYRRLLSQAQNTSYGLMMFREWIALDEAQPILDVTKNFASHGGATAITTQVADQFIESHIRISRSQISLSTEQAKQKFQARAQENRFNARCLASNLSLVISN